MTLPNDFVANRPVTLGEVGSPLVEHGPDQLLEPGGEFFVAEVVVGVGQSANVAVVEDDSSATDRALSGPNNIGGLLAALGAVGPARISVRKCKEIVSPPDYPRR